MFSLGNMRLKDGLIILYSYMKGGCSQVGIAWCTQVTHNKTRGNCIKLSDKGKLHQVELGELYISYKEIFLTKRFAKFWNELSRQVDES